MSDKLAIVPVADLERMADAIAKSGLFGIKTKEQAVALMLIAQAEGLHPAIAARDYNIIQGRPSKTTEAMQRSFLEAGGKIEWKQLDDEAAEAVFSHAQGGSIPIRWDMKRAKAAGLGGRDMWAKYPRQMLRARCISEGVRTIWPGATSGLYVPEEVEDFGPKNVTPPPKTMKIITPEVNAISTEKLGPSDEIHNIYPKKTQSVLPPFCPECGEDALTPNPNSKTGERSATRKSKRFYLPT
jgi:hypothetical protein